MSLSNEVQQILSTSSAFFYNQVIEPILENNSNTAKWYNTVTRFIMYITLLH